MQTPTNLTGLTQNELVSFIEQAGQPAYRGRQIFAGLHHRRLPSFSDMTDLPKATRDELVRDLLPRLAGDAA